MPSLDFLIEADRDLQQLLVAERSMIFTDPKSPLFKQFVSEYETNLKQSAERWNNYKKLAQTADEKALFSVYDRGREQWLSISSKVIELAKAGSDEDIRQARDLTLGDAKTDFEHMRDQLDKLTEINMALAKQSSEKAQATSDFTLKVLMGRYSWRCCYRRRLAWMIAGMITRPVNAMVLGLKDIAQGEGDLTKRLDAEAKDELGESGRLVQYFHGKAAGLDQVHGGKCQGPG